MQAERRDIPGHPGYAADAAGHVWSCRGRRSLDGKPVWRKLAPAWKRKSKCFQVLLYAGGRARCAPVARLVFEAFVGPKPSGLEGCHNDGNPRNNRIENLRYDTHQENMRDKERHGTVARGERAGNVKLTEARVREIRRLCAGGLSQAKAGRLHGVSQVRIHFIVAGKAWRHVRNDAQLVARPALVFVGSRLRLGAPRVSARPTPFPMRTSPYWK